MQQYWPLLSYKLASSSNLTEAILKFEVAPCAGSVVGDTTEVRHKLKLKVLAQQASIHR